MNQEDRELAPRRLSEALGSQHWVGDFISALLGSHELAGGADFATAEKLLATEKQEFERDLAIARKMLQLYPGLVQKKEE